MSRFKKKCVDDKTSKGKYHNFENVQLIFLNILKGPINITRNLAVGIRADFERINVVEM